jgi:hypothetical protein
VQNWSGEFFIPRTVGSVADGEILESRRVTGSLMPLGFLCGLIGFVSAGNALIEFDESKSENR